MAYLCYVELRDLSVPHFEPLDAGSPDEAKHEALRLLRRHRSAVVAQVYEGNQPLFEVRHTEPEL
jgi:hypothetical protein